MVSTFGFERLVGVVVSLVVGVEVEALEGVDVGEQFLPLDEVVHSHGQQGAVVEFEELRSAQFERHEHVLVFLHSRRHQPFLHVVRLPRRRRCTIEFFKKVFFFKYINYKKENVILENVFSNKNSLRRKITHKICMLLILGKIEGGGNNTFYIIAVTVENGIVASWLAGTFNFFIFFNK